MPEINNKLLLICGVSGTGKSFSFKDLPDQQNWWYLNAEAGKALPYRNKFSTYVITDPYEVISALEQGTTDPECKGIIVDSLTFLMDMFETNYVLAPGADSRKAWGLYQQYFKTMLQNKVPLFNKPVFFTAHVMETQDEKTLDWRTSVPIKGALKGNGVEAYFNNIIYAKKMSIKKLEKYIEGNNLLHITDEEKELGFKHVFQTRLTAETIGERIRGPYDMFSKQETFIDNDVSQVLKRIDEYYAN
jgi:hypothetical protein